MADITKEIRRLPSNDPGPEPVHVGILYPNTYPVAVSSLGFQSVHRIAHAHPGVITHRIVADNVSGDGYPSKTLEERLDIKSLDAILISCSFELDYLHIVRMLNEAGIPVLRKDRGALPIVVIGGIAPTANPEPVAEIADAIAIGAGEIILPGILDDFIECYPFLTGAGFNKGREKLYELWSGRSGVYVQSVWDQNDYAKINQAAILNPDDYPSYTPIISPDGVYGAKNLIGLSGGCPSHCKFCLLSFVYPAGNHMSVDKVLENARIFSPDEASVGLVSSRISDHPDLVEILDRLTGDGYTVSVSSLKASSTSREMLGALYRAGTRTVTFAPEHGSPEIRELIAKQYTYEDIREVVGWSLDEGIPKIKLYFLTGFEEETEDDLKATTEFILSLADDVGIVKRAPESKISVGIAPFVPKPSTPFQRRPMQPEKLLKSKIRMITDPLKKHPRIDSESESPRASIIQGTLSIAGREISAQLNEFSHTRGNLYAAWDGVLRGIGDEVRERVLEYRDRSAILPWGFINRPQRC